MAFDHIMIDLETMGTRFDAPIVSIGAVLFNPSTGEQRSTFYRQIDIDDSFRFAKASGSTVKFWLEQEAEARKHAISGKEKLAQALTDLAQFYDEGGKLPKARCVWGNGPTFDIAILEYAYERCLGRKAPWPFWCVRDCRTVRDLAHDSGIEFVLREGVHHNALDDAKHQANWVSQAWRWLRCGQAPVTKQQSGSQQSPSLDDILG